MPHSHQTNEKRRRLYRQARQLGLSPRDAGHYYSDRKWVSDRAALLPLPVEVQRNIQPSATEQGVSRAAQRGVPHPVYYPTKTSASYYKARLTLRHTDGHKSEATVTMTRGFGSPMPTRQRLLDLAHQFIRNNTDAYEEDGIPEVEGVTFVEEQVTNEVDIPAYFKTEEDSIRSTW